MEVIKNRLALVCTPDGRRFAKDRPDDSWGLTCSVEMLDCPWDGEGEAWRSLKLVPPMNRTRQSHGACFFEGMIFTAAGMDDESVEYLWRVNNLTNMTE